MSTNPQIARQHVFTRISDCWTARAPAIVGSGTPKLRFQGDELGDKPKATEYWARASTQHVTTRQSAHQMPAEGEGGSDVVYETHGVVFVQVFAPMKPGAWAKGELLAIMCQGIFMASETPSGVWFRNPRFNELENDGTWYRWNVIADFQFNQVKGA
jgi:hypothetical protein